MQKWGFGAAPLKEKQEIDINIIYIKYYKYDNKEK